MSGPHRTRILQVLSEDGFGGTEMMAATVFPMLDKARFEVEFALPGTPGMLGPRLSAAGHAVHYLGRRRALALAELARRGGFDIVHLYGFRTTLLGRTVFAALSPRTRRIVGVRGLSIVNHGNLDDRFTKAVLRVERVFSALTDTYVSNSQGAIEFLSSAGVAAAKLRHVPNGLDVRTFPLAEAIGSPPVIVCVARFVALKRHADLLRAVAAVRADGVEVRLLLIGAGAELEATRQLARELALPVEFTGRLTPAATTARLRSGDIFVLPSEWEGMSRAVMEAMAVGLPVVGTDVNGIAGLVQHELTGLLVPVGDVPALAAAIRRLAVDADTRQRFGHAGRARIECEFDIAATVAKLERIYAEPRIDGRVKTLDRW